MDKLLTLLSDGQFHSGEELGAALGISRSAIWKKLKVLESYGLMLDKVKGRGYRLPGNIELYDQSKVMSEVSADVASRVGFSIQLTTASTNDAVLELADRQEPVQVCLAEYQTAGRGRRGRTWSSPFGSSFYYSMLWKVEGGLAALDGLSLLVGLTVVRTLESFQATGLQLKWPNDILWQGRKLAGILLEISGDPTGDCRIVIGIGVNLVMTREQKTAIDQPVADVMDAVGVSVSKSLLAGRLTDSLVSVLDVFRQSGFEAFRQQWLDYDAFAGRDVRLIIGNRTVTGKAAGIDSQGALLLETEEGVQSYVGGEVSLRLIS